ncbi:MAG: hypothetical protein HY457_00355 [Parcubacteria group bacterium]|nr:hypothetical protein [Parcubacteria group bacterium]
MLSKGFIQWSFVKILTLEGLYATISKYHVTEREEKTMIGMGIATVGIWGGAALISWAGTKHGQMNAIGVIIIAFLAMLATGAVWGG